MKRKLNSKLPNAIFLTLLVVGILWGQSVLERQPDPLTAQVEQIRELVGKNQWDQVKLEVKELESRFEEHRWMMELFGPVEYVNDVSQMMAVLAVAADQEEENDARKQLAQLEARFGEFIIL